jgi:hypothetical protein
MENPDGTFTCHWCASSCARRYLTGRKPHYCNASCRQRAYEHRRRGAQYPGYPFPATVPTPRRPPLQFEAGRYYRLRHALRPAGLPDQRGHRPTLCGAWALATRPRFGDPLDSRARYCATCQTIAEQHPPPRSVDPSTDLAVVTHQVTRLTPHAEHHDLFTYLGLSQAA